MNRLRGIYLGQVAALVVVYFGAAKLGLAFSFVGGNVSAVWPPTGIALAALLLFGRRLWPGVALGAFLANALTDLHPAVACGIAVGNTLEAVIGVTLLQRVGFRNELDRLRDVLALIVLAAGAATTISATLGVASLGVGRVFAWDELGPVWATWWLGDMMGALIVTPVLLVWPTGQERTSGRMRQIFESTTLLLTLLVAGVVLFGNPVNDLGRFPLAYIVLPLVVWAAIRFGPRGVATVLTALSGIAIWGTIHGQGPFAAGTLHESLLQLQAFLGIVCITGLMLAAVTVERRQAEQTVSRSRDELEERVIVRTKELRESE